MDILTNKSRKEYDYLSRYSTFSFYYNTKDKKYIYGLSSQLKTQNMTYVTVKVTESTTLDFLANKYYGRPDYFWIIADFNHIIDPFIHLADHFSEIKIPNMSEIEFEEK